MSYKTAQLIERATGPVAIPMTNDYLFKALLQKNKRVLKALICSLLHYNPSNIRKLQIINPIILGEAVDEKDIILDVNVTFNGGSILDLEMQVVNRHNWPERSLYYTCRNYTNLNKGDIYEKAMPSIHIGLLDFTPFPQHPVFYDTYQLRDKSGHLYTDKLSIGVVDLTLIHLATTEDQRYNIDKWAKLFKSQTWEDIKMLAKQDTGIRDAATTIYQLSEDERIRQQCEAREDYYRIQRGMAWQVKQLKTAVTKRDKKIAKQEQQLTRQNQTISQQADQITQQADQITQQADKLSQQAARIAELEAQLAAKET